VAEVAVTFAPLDLEADALDQCRDLLDEPERARAARFRFARDRRRFVVRRATLRRLLAEHCGGRAEALRFEENGFGKPRLSGGPHFSASHSGERMMAAIADVEVGADIERIDAGLAWSPLAESLFAASERAALTGLPDAEACTAFFRCWARKEAFVKALGLGLSYPLDAFAVSVSAEAALRMGGEGWAIAAADGAVGYAAAVVARDDGRPLVIRTSDSTSCSASRATVTASAA
jgi:4'-phosphopantetheinyl transferase